MPPTQEGDSTQTTIIKAKVMEISHELLPHQCEGVLYSVDNSSYLLLEERDIQQASFEFFIGGEVPQWGGSTRSGPLLSGTLSITQLLNFKVWTLLAVHIKRELDVFADSLSGNLPFPAKWTLVNNSFQWLISLGSAPQATSHLRLPL